MKVLYFAWLKQKVGLAEEEVTPPSDVTDVAALLHWLSERSPRHAEALAVFERVAGMVRVTLK